MSASVTVTVPSGKVSTNLSSFVVKVDLADMPGNFWLACDGDNVRVKQSGSDLPFDVISIDLAAKTGELYFKAPTVNSGSDNVFTIEAVDGAVAPAVTDTNGRNAVWSDYDLVVNFAELVDRTGAGHDPAIVGTVASEFAPPATQSSNDHWSQGVAWDATGSNWFSTATNEIRKYNSTFTGSITKSDPIGDAGLTAAGVNHVGDPVVVGTELFTVMEKYTNSPYNNQWVVVFDVATLTYQRKYDISANAHECSSITHDGTYFYISDFTDPRYIHKYNSSFVHQATLTLPSPIDSMQGITWKTGFFYIMSGPHVGTSYVWKVADDMSSATKVYSGGAALEGVQLIGNDLYFCDPAGIDHLVKLAYQGTTGEAGWLTLAGSGHALVTSLPKRTAWTMAATVKWAAIPTANRGILSYSDNSSSDSNRASLLGRSTSVWAMWNSGDGFTNGTGSTIVSGDVSARRRVHHVQDTTTSRKLYLKGVIDATDTGASQRPAGGSSGTMALFIGAEDGSASERMNGKIGGVVYLRNGALAAAWIAAEQASWEATGFYAAVATPIDATASGVVPAVAGSSSLGFTGQVTASGVVPAVSGSVALTSPGLEATANGVVPGLTGTSVLLQPGMVAAGVVPALTGAVSLVQPVDLWEAAVRDVAGSDLMAWYRHAEREGATVMVDSSGNGHHGTFTSHAGGPHAAPPLVGTGGSTIFGGSPESTGGSASVPDGGWFDVTNGWSIGLWFDYTPLSLFSQQRIISKTYSFDAFLSASTSPQLVVGGVNTIGSYGIQTFDDITTGRHFVVWSMESDVTSAAGNPEIRLYIDGVLATYNSPPVASTNRVDHSEPITFGYQNGSAPDPLWGAMDETVIFGRPLSDADVAELYLAGIAATATATGVVPALTGSSTLTIPPAADLTANGVVPAPAGSVTLDLAPMITAAGVVPALTGTTVVALTPIAELTAAGVVPALTGTSLLRPPMSMTATGVVPGVTGAIDLHGADSIFATGVVPALSGVVSFTVPPQTLRTNRVGGRRRDGIGVVFFEPAVTPAPVLDAVAHTKLSAAAYSDVVMNGTQPVFSATRAHMNRDRTRIVIGGHDVTYFRGVPTPEPTYSLITPLLYGSASIVLPQVAVPFETPGHGALTWLKPGARVLVQRVDEDDEVLATDYKGVVVKFGVRPDTSGAGGLEVQVGGEAAGRAAMIDKQPPLFFKRNDLGFWWWGGIQDLGLRFEPRLGPDTGIVLRNNGGMGHLDYLNDLSAKGARRNGAQLTCMPDAHETGGAYRVTAKDLDTIHATVYLDDSVSVPSLDRDIAEEPNRIFATGVTPESMRVRFGAYPMLRDATPPPYPMADDSVFGIGTTDGDTDTGDGVSVMIWRLVKAGYLALADKPGGYDSDVADAIRDLKEDAGEAFINGDMTPAAWAALFDVSATGYSLAGTVILPAAQRSATKKWLRSANGSVIGANPDYDPTKLRVDSTVDMGVGMTRKQMRSWSRAELGTGQNWVGTITLRAGAVIAGEHNPGDALTADDLMDARALRPGMNVWCPQFAGGTLFHVSGVEKGEAVVLTVDTQARDTMKVWQVITRNRDSRRNPARAWLAQNRSSALTKDAVGEFDEIGGVLDDRVDLAAGAWTVFPVVAGQEGVIRSLRFETDAPTEFVTAVFGRQIKPARLDTLIGNPLTKRGKRKWADETVRDHLDADYVLLYAAGDKKNPCGYFPGMKHPDPLEVDDSDDDATDGPDLGLLTGRWEDDAGFSYHCFDGPVLWVAVWSAEVSHILPGRVMWPQLESGS